jgi:hypothetical protein
MGNDPIGSDIVNVITNDKDKGTGSIGIGKGKATGTDNVIGTGFTDIA